MLRPTTVRAVLRPQQRCLLRGAPGQAAAARRTLFTSKQQPRLTQELDLNKLNAQRRDYERNRTAFLAAGAIAGILSFIYTAWKLKNALALQREQKKEKEASIKCDAPPIPTEIFKTEAGEKRKVVLHDEEGNEIVPTGNSTVPVFPRTIDLNLPGDQVQRREGGPNSITTVVDAQTGTEYTLVGLGMRSVTFIGIQVYLVGLYVATQDVAKLQHYLVKKINPLATTLIPSEKEELRKRLRDPKEGEQMWDDILKDAGCRTAFRISPVRDTDFHHLRDGFVRAIQGRSQRDKAFHDEAFGAAMKDFKALFNRGSVLKKKEMLLCRGQSGELAVTYGGIEGGKAQREVMGTIKDERLSRLLWLNYLAGSKVASDEARNNIIEGVMEFVERPVGTVATQVL